MGLSTILTKNSKALVKLQSGYIFHYTFLILICLTIFLGARQLWLLVGNILDYRILIILIIQGFLINTAKTS